MHTVYCETLKNKQIASVATRTCYSDRKKTFFRN